MITEVAEYELIMLRVVVIKTQEDDCVEEILQ